MHRIVSLSDIRCFFPDTEYSVTGYSAKSALNKFLPALRALNYQIQYTVVSAAISIFYRHSDY